MRRVGGVVGCCLALAALAACGDDAPPEADSPADVDADDDAGPLAGLLASVPDAGDNAAFVIVNDFDGAREANDLDDLDDDAAEDEVVDHLLALTVRAEGVAPLPSELAGGETSEQAAREDEIGFHFAAVEADVVAGIPPEHLQVVAGDFDPDAIEDAVQDDPVWSDVLEEGEVDGVPVYSWLDDLETDFERVSETHPIGESARLAVLGEDRLAWARADEVLEPLFEGEDTLADRDDLGDLAEVLDEAGAVSAVLSGDLAEREDAPGDFAPYSAFAVAGGVNDEGEPLLFVALWHEEEDAAEANVDALEDYADAGSPTGTWPEVIPVDVDQEDHVVLGTFRVELPSSWSRLAFIGDPLLQADTD
jgi:hypothetical protein